jgi:quinohemoprotein ethanol dehydrogenase
MNAVINWRLAFAACTIMGLQAAQAQIQPAPAFTPAELSVPPTTGWITNGGTLSNQRFSPLKEIDRGSVGRLKAKWRTHLASGGGAQHSGQGQPIVHAGVIYITTGASDVLAVSVEKGEVLWRYEASLDANLVRTCCGWVNRGVALGDGKVFVGRLDAQLVALDQRTGKPVWTVQAEDPLQGYSIVSAPLYYDGLVITGFGGGEHATRGRMKAFDAKTGKLVWTFHTIPGPGEFGHDSWPADNEAWKNGGAPIWNTPAVDPQLGVLYFSTGNAWPDFNGSGRKGDNLFTVSIVALDVKTGKYRWHFQQVHHDIWDYDSPNPVILFDAPYEGRLRKGIAEVSKTGWVYILDRETGKPLTPIEERTVIQEPRQHTAATQPYVIGDAVVPQEIDIPPEGFEPVNRGRIFTPYWDKVVLYKPQMGVNWPPSSYDPATHRMFICGIDHVASSISDMRPFEAPADHVSRLGGGGANPGVARRGTFTAMNLITNRIVWQQQWSSDCFNGTLATAGGLVFVGRSDGRFTALDADTGNRLWQFQTDAGVAASPSTFEYNGHQYVVVLAAGTQYGGGKKGDSLWLFSLDGSLESLPPEQPAGAAPIPVVALPPGPANIAQGKTAYRQFCVACHGEQGMGGQGGGASLAAMSRDVQAIANMAAAGKNAMPAFRLMLSSEQLRDVAGYISTELFPAHPQ